MNTASHRVGQILQCMENLEKQTQTVVVLICSRALIIGASEEIPQQSTGETSRQTEEVETMNRTGPTPSSKMNNSYPLNTLDQDKI